MSQNDLADNSIPTQTGNSFNQTQAPAQQQPEPSPTVTTQVPTYTNQPAPNNSNQSNVVYPKNTQIFLHPDHEAIKAATARSQGGGINGKLVAFLVLIALSFLVLGSYFFFLLPRAKTVRFAKEAHDSINSNSSQLSSVNKDLTSLYDKLTGQNSGVVVTDSEVTAKENSSQLLEDINNFMTTLGNSITKKGSVAGFSTPADDPNKPERDIRDLAVTVQKDSDSAQTENDKLSGIISNGIPSEANSIKDKLQNLQTDTGDYLDETQKTTNFYITLADNSIQLNDLLSTATNADLAIAQLSAMRDKFTSLKQSGLPAEMDKFNGDLINIYDLLIGLYKDTKNLSVAAQVPIVNRYQADLTSLLAVATEDQISFWKNNQTLNNYKNISADQLGLLQETKAIQNNNNFFLLDWLSIS